MSKERIIPIQIEKSEDENSKSGSDTEKNISKPMEELTLKLRKPNVQVKTKPNIEEEYLKEFDMFDENIKCTLPNANIPEKIIIVIDQAQDENVTPFKIKKNSFTPLSMLKRTVQVFIRLKHMINKHHEFAVVLLNTNNAVWYLKFSTEVRKINNYLDRLNECEVEDTFKMNSVFEEILENITLPEVTNNVPPPYLFRVVMFYGRSYTHPLMEFSENVKKLLEHPYFICDIIMTHEPVDKSNHCKEIFESLQNLDKKGYSYFFPVCRDVRRLHNCNAKLLAHPLQRPCQKFKGKN